MKRQLWFFAPGLAAIGAVVYLFTGAMAIANPGSAARPTPAPSATPYSGVIEALPTSVPLARPLTTDGEALRQALVFDANVATWAEPWWDDTTTIETGRVTIEQFSDRMVESQDAGRDEWFAPEVVADAGAVWRISVVGEVRLQILTMGRDDLDTVYQGVTYVVSGRTGNLLAVMSQMPK
jgi:hypothetical protein